MKNYDNAGKEKKENNTTMVFSIYYLPNMLYGNTIYDKYECK